MTVDILVGNFGAADLSVIAICSNMAEPVLAFQLPEIDVLLKIPRQKRETDQKRKKEKKTQAFKQLTS